jgi:hypothetical protein
MTGTVGGGLDAAEAARGAEPALAVTGGVDEDAVAQRGGADPEPACQVTAQGKGET